MAQKQTEVKFQERLQKTVATRIILLVLISMCCFVVGQYLVTWLSNQSNAQAHLGELEESFLCFDRESRDFLMDENTWTIARQLVTGSDSQAEEQLNTLLWKFQERCGISSNVLLTTSAGAVCYTSFGPQQLTTQRVSYNNAICYNAKNSGEDAPYRAVCYVQGDYADTMYVRPLYDGGKLEGYITIFLSGSAWNVSLSDSSFDGVITDLRNNAMYVSKPGLLDGYNKYYGASDGIWYNGESRYWVTSRNLPEQGAVIHSLVYYPPNDGILVGFLILLAMGIAWYSTARWMSRTMAEKKAASVEELVRQIRMIGSGDGSQRIEMDTGDEFTEVSLQINHMLASIMELNARNTELVRLSGRIEMAQLAAQMNPHFLYNTLELIRNLVIFDSQKSEKIILNLTGILRYSVDETKEEVLLSEDMKYIASYLEIQNCRFGDRFRCTIDFSPDCLSCRVPKLLLQPLIENSIKYGYRQRMELSIQITGRVEDQMLYIQVVDDGLGMSEENARRLEQQLLSYDNTSLSLGLRNLSRRLYLQYGEQSGMRIRNTPGVGFEVDIRIDQRKEASKCTKS